MGGMEATTTQESCGACGRAFDSLDEVFSHECSEIPETVAEHHPLRRSDNVDAPERVEGRGGKSYKRMDKGNRYGGWCVKCNGYVPEQAGYLVKDNSKQRGGTVWGVVHKPGECQTQVEATQPARPTGGMSEKQESFLRTLLAERQPDADPDGVVRTINEMPNPRQGASAMIEALLSIPKPAKVKNDELELVKGDVHVVEGEYYRVHEAQGSGRQYACKWDGTRFEYERGAISKLNESNKITAEEAAAFGHMFERCCFCSAAIDTPESVAVGYGPICATKHGLPWG